MNINEYVDIAKRIESLIRRTETFGKTKNDVLDELLDIAEDLRSQADRIEAQMISETDLWYDTSKELA